MKIGILGTRGIPNRYGGFEQFAEQLSIALVEKGMEIFVYCPKNHEYKGKTWKGVHLIHKYCPGFLGPSLSQIVYDLFCILDSRHRGFDRIYQLGYTSSSIWYDLHPPFVAVITNMDGVEWERKKYGWFSRKFLKYAEKLAVLKSHELVVDSARIQKYLYVKFRAIVSYFPYWADIPDDDVISGKLPEGLEYGSYYLAVARFQPENNLEMIIRGYLKSGQEKPLVIIGNFKNRHGRYLRRKYACDRIIFYGPLYDKDILDNLRFNSKAYFHGHSAGGTNPSLVEAMAAEALVCAHDNQYNREVLRENAFYFKSEEDVTNLLKNAPDKYDHNDMILNNIRVVENKFSKKLIVERYISFFNNCTCSSQVNI